MIHGIDVSAVQPVTSDWSRTYAEGARFAWVKACEGESWRDRSADLHRQRLAAAGFRVAPYAYGRVDYDAERCARNFVECIDPAIDLPPVLDLEPPGVRAPDREHAAWADRARVVRWAEDFLEVVEESVPWRICLYTGPSTYDLIRAVRPSSPLFARSLWLSTYPLDPMKPKLADWPTKAPSWDSVAPHAANVGRFRWSAWQWTGFGQVPGCSVWIDRNVFAGDEGDLVRWVGEHWTGPPTREPGLVL